MATNANAPVDDQVVVPRAVREQVERAAAAQRASIGVAEPPVLPPETASPPAEGSPPSSSPPVETSPAADPPPQAPTSDDNESWEVRYRNIRGRMDAERKKHREELSQMGNRLQHLEEQLRTRPNDPPPQPRPPKLNITQDELADYGDGFIDMVKRVAEGVVDGRIEPLNSEMGRTRAQIGVQQNKTMHQQMDALYPYWRQMNEHEPFIQWVMLPDPYSGAIRQKLMQEAWDSGDARRVLAFFQGFHSEEAALNPAGGGAAPAARAPAAPNGAPAATPQLALSDLAAPGGARSASHAPAEKRTYSTEDISRFYTEVAAGRWRGRDKERAEIDADIMRAQHEGRILLNNRRFTPPDAPRGYSA
jgi:hypothetical protein